MWLDFVQIMMRFGLFVVCDRESENVGRHLNCEAGELVQLIRGLLGKGGSICEWYKMLRHT